MKTVNRKHDKVQAIANDLGDVIYDNSYLGHFVSKRDPSYKKASVKAKSLIVKMEKSLKALKKSI